jgi:flagellar L-ring protein precursor FlgH
MTPQMQRAVAPLCAAIVLLSMLGPEAHAKKKKPNSPAELRSDYIARLQEVDVSAPQHTLGSLWSAGGDLNDLSNDYKARKVNDTLVIVASVQTTASQEGDVTTSRAASTTTGITGLPGELSTAGVNPLFAANTTTALKGSGQTDSNTTFQTSLTAQVVAVLPSGNMVVEAERKIFMNNQHEDIVIRGVVRPNDIGPNNTVPSAALGNLEIEVKGKGIISDATHRLNPIARAILWLIGL